MVKKLDPSSKNGGSKKMPPKGLRTNQRRVFFPFKDLLKYWQALKSNDKIFPHICLVFILFIYFLYLIFVYVL